ncbi:Hsp20/alpha crystallin family protein [Telluribacter sp.]|jgi:HSP20 family molecular chaperone IbpA|uniref:Hsp20/alpha crystallin family protein n=1 Tax=Telluribacter sp. TaxID=1978767 RepID=UPI002E1387C3|nr:Hsp20/alpha crystallin family protein [Telluribacter sp.]
MKNKMKIPQEVLMNIDFINTVNGGMSQPTVEIESGQDGYQVMVKAPGIEAEDLQVEIIKNKLMVFHLLPIFAHDPEANSEYRSIRFISNLTIPNDVDLESIAAHYDETLLHVVIHLPYNQLHQGFHRKVDIERWK